MIWPQQHVTWRRQVVGKKYSKDAYIMDWLSDWIKLTTNFLYHYKNRICEKTYVIELTQEVKLNANTDPYQSLRGPA